MEHGSCLLDSENVSEGVDCYHAMISAPNLQVSGLGSAEVVSLELLVDGAVLSDREPLLDQGVEVLVRLKVRVLSCRKRASISVFVHDQTMSPVVSCSILKNKSELLSVLPGEYELMIPLWDMDLNTGKYSFVVSVKDIETAESLIRVQGLQPFRVSLLGTHWGKVVRPMVATSVRSEEF